MTDQSKPSGKNFVVFGATGLTGLELVKQGLSQGHTMTAFVRNPDKLKDIHGVNIVKAELRDEDIMQATIKGKDAVLVSLGSRNLLTADRTSSQGTKIIIDAMKEAGVSRIIAVSSYGAGPGNRSYLDWFVRKLLTNVLDDKDKQEEIIVQSGLDYTIVRPPRLMNKPAQGNLFVTTALSYKLPIKEIARADVASFMLQCAAERSYVKETVSISWSKPLI